VRPARAHEGLVCSRDRDSSVDRAGITSTLKMAEPTMADIPSSNWPCTRVEMTVVDSSGKLEPTATTTAPVTMSGSS